MAEPLALVTGDWHIRKTDRVWYRRQALYGDTKFGIQQVCKMAEQYDVQYVFMLGDLFDIKMQESPGLVYMRDALDIFERQQRNVYYVQGQHELSDPPILAAMHDWPTHIHGNTMSLPGLPPIHGLDYQRPNYVREALEKVPKDCILATHQVWRDFMGETRGDAWLHWAPAKYIFTGDFHQSLYEQRGDQWVLSPGPLCMQSISEPAAKYVYIVYDNMDVLQTRLHSRGYFEARIHDQQQLEKFLDTWHKHPAGMPQAGVPAEISTNILRVWYREDIPQARSRIEARVGEAAHLFFKIIPVEEEAITVDAERRIQAVLQGGLDGCIRNFYADNPAVCEDALRLVHAQDISSELVNIFKDRMYGNNSDGKGTLPEADQSAAQGAPSTASGRGSKMGSGATA